MEAMIIRDLRGAGLSLKVIGELVAIKRREAAPPAGIFEVPRWVPVAGAAACVLFLVLDLATIWH